MNEAPLQTHKTERKEEEIKAKQQKPWISTSLNLGDIFQTVFSISAVVHSENWGDLSKGAPRQWQTAPPTVLEPFINGRSLNAAHLYGCYIRVSNVLSIGW